MTGIFEIINEKLTAGDGSVAGKILGECAAMDHLIRRGPSGQETYMAYIYLWDNDFADWSQIAQWFLDAGATDVSVSWVMYDHANGDKNGRTEDDGSRPVIVYFSLPAGHQRLEQENPPNNKK